MRKTTRMKVTNLNQIEDGPMQTWREASFSVEGNFTNEWLLHYTKDLTSRTELFEVWNRFKDRKLRLEFLAMPDGSIVYDHCETRGQDWLPSGYTFASLAALMVCFDIKYIGRTGAMLS